MFGTLGMQEILLLMGLALLIFGPKRLPEIGRTMGRAMGEFRRATTDLKRTLEYEADQEERRSSSSQRALPASGPSDAGEPVTPPSAKDAGETAPKNDPHTAPAEESDRPKVATSND